MKKAIKIYCIYCSIVYSLYIIFMFVSGKKGRKAYHHFMESFFKDYDDEEICETELEDDYCEVK